MVLMVLAVMWPGNDRYLRYERRVRPSYRVLLIY